jgi:molecular chaperone DnaK (HSP70)
VTGPRPLHAIDFGTSTSAIVVCEPGMPPRPVRDHAGAAVIPTAICALPDGGVRVGREAENAKRLYPGAYRSEFKAEFGAATPAAPGELLMTADAMAVEVIGFLRERALETVPAEPDSVVVTIPASWEAGNKSLMRDVVRRAGYRDAGIDLIPEPVAAAAHALDVQSPPGHPLNVLVYDLGGGTFDCAVARGDAGWFEVLGKPDGKRRAGGAVFDRVILGLAAGQFGPAMPPPLTADGDDPGLIRRWLNLNDACEQVKWRLSTDEDPVEEMLWDASPPGLFTVTRARFEAAIGPLVAETVRICDRLLSDQGMDWPDLDRVVPVGGSSQIPLVGRLLAARGRPVLKVESPEMAVVLGAARLGQRRRAGTAPTRIFVNGRHAVVPRPALDFDELVDLAFGQPPGGPFVTVTVTYANGPQGAAEGSLLDGQRVQVAEDMVFNVIATDRS